MAIPVVKKIKVLEAKYVKEAESIVLVGECAEGRFSNQIHSSCFTFGDRNVDDEMTKTAYLLIGKTIGVAFDTELDGKIKDHYKLKY
jgi:hypothetical protein